MLFNLAIKQINEIVPWLKETNEITQPLPVHIDIDVYLSKKYPHIADSDKLNLIEIKETFGWFDRVNSKIPKKFRDGIKESADHLFVELAAVI